METDTFATRSEAIDFGKDYEFLMAAYYGLSFTFNDAIKDFMISSNNKEMGDFDDVVIEIETQSGEYHLFALQLKHVKRKIALVTLTNTKSKNKNFSLHKYIHEFSIVKKQCQSGSSYKADFRNFHFLLYTNSILEKCDEIDEVGKRLEIRDTDEICDSDFTIFKNDNVFGKELFDLSDSKDCTYQFKTITTDSVEEEFFKQFYFYTQQKTAVEMESLISKKLLKIFENSDTNIVVNYLNYFKYWCRRDFGAFKITKNDLRTKFAEYFLTPLIPTPNLEMLEYYSRKSENLFKVITDHDLTIVETKSDPERILNKLWGILLNEFRSFDNDWLKPLQSITMSHMTKKFNIPMSAQAENFNQISLRGVYIILWHMNLTPLVIMYNDSFKYDLFNALNLLNKKKIRNSIVLVGNDIPCDVFDITKTWRVFRNLCNCMTRKDLLGLLNLSIQGRPPITLREFINFDKDLSNVISMKELLQMLDDTFTIGQSNYNRIPPHYIKRSLSRTFLKIAAVDQVETDLFVLSLGKTDIKAVQKYLEANMVELERYLVLQGGCNNGNYNLKHSSIHHLRQYQEESLTIKAHLVIYVNGFCSNEKFIDICSLNLDRNCHHVRLLDGSILEWITTSGSIENLRNYRLEFEQIPSMATSDIQLLSDNKLNFIVGEAGMGKTTYFHYLKQHHPTKGAVFKVDFNKHINYFKDFHNVDEVLKYFLEIESKSEFELRYFQYLANKQCLVFLWDGFDDLPRNCYASALHIIKLLRAKGFYQWISARSNVQNMLEKELNVFASNMILLSSNEQFNFIYDSLRNHLNPQESLKEIVNKLIDNMITSLNCGYFNYIGIPLHLNMTVEIFKQNPEKYIDSSQIITLADIYLRFLDGKFEEIFRKAEADLENHLMEDIYKIYKNTLVFKHEVAALKAALPDEIFSSLNLDLEELDLELGIVSGFDDGGRPIFTHKTYQEFLCALWLSKNENYVKHPQMVNLLFDEEFRSVRLFFDMIVAKKSPVHLAVIYRKLNILAQKKSEIKTTTDDLGRSPLQLSCCWGFHHSTIKSRTMQSEDTNTLKSKQLKKHDDDNYRSLQVLTILLESNCDPFQKDNLNFSAIDYCLKSSSFEELEVICKLFKNVHFNELEGSKIIDIVHYAVKYGYINIFNKLDNNIPFIEYEDGTNLLQLAIQSNKIEVVSKLLQVSSYAATLEDLTSKENPLSIALEQENLSIFQLLFRNYSSVRRFKVPPLTIAAKRGLTSICDMLLQKGADINECDPEQKSALLHATKNNHLDTVQLLLQKGANINHMDSEGRNALKLATPAALQLILPLKPDLNLKCCKFGYTALHIAAGRGSLDNLRFLLDAGSEINTISNEGNTALHIAATNNNPEVITELIIRGANLDMINLHKETALFQAVKKNNVRVLEILAEAGASVNLDNTLKTPLHVAVENSCAASVEVLLKNGALVNALDYPYKQTPIFKAADVTIAELLIKYKCDLSARDENGTSPLLLAAYYNRLKVVKFLLNNGADINIVDNKNKNILNYCIDGFSDETLDYILKFEKINFDNRIVMEAVNMNSCKCLEVLLRNNADANFKFRSGETPLLAAALRKTKCFDILLEHGADPNLANDANITPLAYSITFGQIDKVNQLIKYGADLTKVEEPNLPLHIAASNGDIIMTIFLLDSGVDIHMVDKLNKTALHHTASRMDLNIGLLSMFHGGNLRSDFDFTASNNYEECTKELIARGSDVNAQDKDMNTVLHLACAFQIENTVEFLVRTGANLDIKNLKGQTPLHIAYKLENVNIINILISNGASTKILDKYDKIPLFYGFRSLVRDYLYSEQLGNEFIDKLVYYKDNGVDLNSKFDDAETLLHYVCYKADVIVLEYLLNNGANIEIRDQEGRTPFYYSCQGKSVEFLKILVKKSVKYFDVRDNKGNSVLHCTVSPISTSLLIMKYAFKSSEKLQITQYLLDLGFDCNERNSEGLTPLHLAVSSKYTELIELFLSGGAKIDEKVVHNAITSNNLNNIRYLHEKYEILSLISDDTYFANILSEITLPESDLLEYLYNNVSEILRQEVFQYVVAKGLLKCAKSLLDKKANPNYKSKTGSTALMLACWYDNFKMTQLLLDYKADVNIQNHFGFTALFFATYSGNSAELVELLISKGAKVDTEATEGLVPLFCAPKSSGAKILKSLVENGADINYKNNKNETVLHHTCKIGNIDGVRYLIEKGADPSAVNIDEETPLHFAVYQNHVEVVKYLITVYKNFMTKNKNQLTPLELAITLEMTDIIDVFLEKMKTDGNSNKWQRYFILSAGNSLTVTKFFLENNIVEIDNQVEGCGTALHLACQYGKLDIVTYLVEAGASVNIQDLDKKTALDYACAGGHREIAEYLKNCGASGISKS